MWYRVIIKTLSFCCGLSASALAQSAGDNDKIAASQGGATPLIFDLKKKDITAIKPGDFNDDRETTVRNGMPNFFDKVKKKQPVTVAFIGGSITQGEKCYRLQTAKYIQDKYPDVKFSWVNAGVSGTGTDLGAFRLQEQVLQYKPDLIFIEFAVNRAYAEGMEGIIRQIIKADASTDICLIYTILNGQTKIYQENKIPENILRLEKLAEHYRLPSVHLGMEAAAMEKEGKLIWKGDKEQKGKILFSTDGIHPIEAGGNLYAAAIARALNKNSSQETIPTCHNLSAPLLTDKWENVKMIRPDELAAFDENWKLIDTKSKGFLQRFSNWFDQVAFAEIPGASFSFSFEGDMFGFFDIGGPEVGQLEFIVDGKPVHLKKMNTPEITYYINGNNNEESTLNRFNIYCNNRYRGQHDLIELEYGKHEVTVKISDKKSDKETILTPVNAKDINANPEKYDRTVVYIGKILIRGNVLKRS
ncbi:SGNH/GDSL hydrolase family protein [Gynurincola endophyticus]|uniref:SGNH/GDSL hydrolase family protein n=1 Tax=Gynurincola endophyticus TaxID=2479004 RepID=UPI000F8D212B|nr:SGNH/GDSL hydrolase family protein [Gynurincola endophyticus]